MLVRKGKPYAFGDYELNREWTIHPFLFQLRHSSFAHKIRIDWEHTDYQWIDPLTIPEDDVRIVPRMAESLRRVYVERDLGLQAGTVLTTCLTDLKSDHQSGASVLAERVLKAFTEIVQTMDLSQSKENWWFNLRMAGWHFWQNGRPAMDAAIRSVVFNALIQTESIIADLPKSDPLSRKIIDQIMDNLKVYQRARKAAVDQIARAYATHVYELGKRLGRELQIITLSSSSTITNAVSLAAAEADVNVPLKLHILESRPLFEGVKAADAFSKLPNTTVTVFPDAAVNHAIQGADMVVLGADRISESGVVINKIGSLSIVLAANHASESSAQQEKIQVVVLGEAEKVTRLVSNSDGKYEGMEENNDIHEITDAWKLGGLDVKVAERPGERGHLHVTNIYFEMLDPRKKPLDNMNWVYICERGKWTVDEIACRAREMETITAKLFDDL